MIDQYILKQKVLVKELEESFAKKDSQRSTVVEIQNDYAHDAQICLTLVAFMPQEIADFITEKIINPLKKIEPDHYYYPLESIHLTIKNIRTIHNPPIFSDTDVQKVKDKFNEIIPGFPAYDFFIEEAVLFPTSLSVMAYSNDSHFKLVSALDQGLKEIGVPDDKKYFFDSVIWGNITVCRFTHNPGKEFIEAVKAMREIKIGKVTVEKVTLATFNAVCYSESRNIIKEYKLK